MKTKIWAVAVAVCLLFGAVALADSGSYYDADTGETTYWENSDEGVSYHSTDGSSDYYWNDGSSYHTETNSSGDLYWSYTDENGVVSGGVEYSDYDSSNSSSSSKSSSSKSSSSSSSSSSTYVAPSTAAVTYVTPYTAQVRTNGGVLNIRASANKGGTILAKLSNGSALTVNGYTGEWLQVTAAGVTGFVPSRYVMSTGAATSATQFPYYAMVNPTNNFVNMRSAPSKSAQVVNVYYYGYRLKVLAESDGWCQVLDETTGAQGYMMKALLLYSGPATDAAEQGDG